ncbi:diphthamide biosynthesis protein [Geopyxis carbonaria]|nr:diphthamide biosynthesis protein [Geopyxis carbonaria]
MVDVDEPTIYDQIEIEDMTFDPATQLYHYPCPCGDRFEILLDDLRDGQEIAVCPSCSLMIQVIFEPEDLPESKILETGQMVAVSA